MLSSAPRPQRGAVYDRLAALAPPPAGAERAAVVGAAAGAAARSAALEPWWASIRESP